MWPNTLESKRNIRRMLCTLDTHKTTDTRLDCNTQTIREKQYWIRPFKNDYDDCSRKMFLRLYTTTQFDQCERGVAVSLIRPFVNSKVSLLSSYCDCCVCRLGKEPIAKKCAHLVWVGALNHPVFYNRLNGFSHFRKGREIEKNEK